MSGNQDEAHMSEKMLDLLDQLSEHYEDGIMCENES